MIFIYWEDMMILKNTPIYKLSFNEDNLSIDYCKNLNLSHNCYFNSNAILVVKKNEEGQQNQVVIMMDSNDNIEEIDLSNDIN